MARFGATRRAAAATAAGCSMAIAVGGCGGGAAAKTGSSTSGRGAAPPERADLAARYLAVAERGNRRLDHDFDPLEDRDRNNLARARADLRDAAATERLFDRRLRTIHFPPATERISRHLYRVNQMRATLTAAAAASSSLKGLHSYEPVLDAANASVERDVSKIRRALGLPPPDSS